MLLNYVYRTPKPAKAENILKELPKSPERQTAPCPLSMVVHPFTMLHRDLGDYLLGPMSPSSQLVNYRVVLGTENRFHLTSASLYTDLPSVGTWAYIIQHNKERLSVGY